MLVSVIVRTLNEGKYLEELFRSLSSQKSGIFEIESVIVDSGSTDETLCISEKHNARITHIKQEEFSFGRSLNIGCDFANGEILAFISGHCIPTSDTWLHDLCLPIYQKIIHYSYGRQIGRDTTKFSEKLVFEKYFPNENMIPQEGFFCNNANAALLRSCWQQYRFDEELTGLEDMELAQRITKNGGLIGYVASATVYHIHDENWNKVKIRYEREAIALQKIMPEVHVSLVNMIHYTSSAIFSDLLRSIRESTLTTHFFSIFAFRFCQYWGAYVGNHKLRKLSATNKRKYFYPNEKVEKKVLK